MTRMTGPDCAVIYVQFNKYTHTHTRTYTKIKIKIKKHTREVLSRRSRQLLQKGFEAPHTFLNIDIYLAYGKLIIRFQAR